MTEGDFDASRALAFSVWCGSLMGRVVMAEMTMPATSGREKSDAVAEAGAKELAKVVTIGNPSGAEAVVVLQSVTALVAALVQLLNLTRLFSHRDRGPEAGPGSGSTEPPGGRDPATPRA